VASLKPLSKRVFRKCDCRVADQFTVYKKRADQAMAPLRLANAVVLQLLTDRDRIAELTVMPAVLSTTIDRDALSLHGATTLVCGTAPAARQARARRREKVIRLLDIAGGTRPWTDGPPSRCHQHRLRAATLNKGAAGARDWYLCCCCDHGAQKLDKASYLALYLNHDEIKHSTVHFR
jgi:hypothetical protein